MTHTARRATAADLPAIVRITHEAYAPYIPLLGREPLPMRLDHAPLVAAGGVWIVARDGAEVGLAALEHYPDHLLIFSLALPPSAQGGGTGRWMLRFAEEQARAAGLPEVRLYTNARMTRNIGIYEAAGYQEVGRRAPDADWPDWFVVDMVKRLGREVD